MFWDVLECDTLASVARLISPSERLWTLVNKGEDFLDLLNHPIIDEMIPWFLGEHAIITTYTANIARPGNQPMQLHTDQVAVQPPIRDRKYHSSPATGPRL